MSNKFSSTSKSSCDHTRSSKGSSHKSGFSFKSTPKKVVTSKKVPSSCTESKSFSSGMVSTKTRSSKPKKTTKSESIVTKKCQKSKEKEKDNVIDYCKKCGDDKNNDHRQEINTIVNAMNKKCVRNDNNVKISKPVQQYYKNEHFKLSEESVPEANSNNKKLSLDPIKEVSELHTVSDDSIFRIFTDSDDEVTYLDPSSEENIKKLKEFRQKNYFECHSAKTRIKNKASATSLNDHKCVYRFYLNDRLFPVPLNTDYNNKVRCVQCHLPMDVKQETSHEKINGTIQAKVKLGTEDDTTQDILLLLPVKDSLIIEERRKEAKNKDDCVYFGIVKLNHPGNSMYNKHLPINSLALKYQKGYQQYQQEERYEYEDIKDEDVIII